VFCEEVTQAVDETPRRIVTPDLDFDRQEIDLRVQPTPIAQLARIATRFFSRAPMHRRVPVPSTCSRAVR